jgi:hypothetical protein
MTLRFETLAPNNTPVNPYTLMAWTMNTIAHRPPHQVEFNAKRLTEKGSSNCKLRKLTVILWLET